MRHAVLSTVPSRKAAETVVAGLRASGVQADDISVLFAEARDTRDFAQHAETHVERAAGVAAGGFIVGTIGVLAGIGFIVIPGPGQILAVAPIIGGLIGIAVGLAGGTAQLLRRAGVTDVDAQLYQDRLQHGGVVIGVHAEDDGARSHAAVLLTALGARDVSRRDDATAALRV